MFSFAWLLPDLLEYRTGLTIVELERCIAMVVIWNDLACGDCEAVAVVVALISVFQVVAFAALVALVYVSLALRDRVIRTAPVPVRAADG